MRRIPNRVTHGMRHTRTYRIWMGMKSRCQNPNVQSYPSYGGRGIKLCDGWQRFEGFLADMGEAPPTLTLERIDVDGNYEPGNSRWATRKEQARNTRRSRRIIYQGRTQSMADWADELGIQYPILQKRLGRGVPFEKAVALEEKHAKRVAACLRACENLPTEAVDRLQGGVRELVSILVVRSASEAFAKMVAEGKGAGH